MSFKLKNDEKIKSILVRYNFNLDLISRLDQDSLKKYITSKLNNQFKYLKTKDDVALFIKDINELNPHIYFCRKRNPEHKVEFNLNNKSTTRVNISSSHFTIEHSCYIVNLHKYFMICL